jgi:hypothetical protein
MAPLPLPEPIPDPEVGPGPVPGEIVVVNGQGGTRHKRSCRVWAKLSTHHYYDCDFCGHHYCYFLGSWCAKSFGHKNRSLG